MGRRTAVEIVEEVKLLALPAGARLALRGLMHRLPA
jgi:hypothetical protein